LVAGQPPHACGLPWSTLSRSRPAANSTVTGLCLCITRCLMRFAPKLRMCGVPSAPAGCQQQRLSAVTLSACVHTTMCACAPAPACAPACACHMQHVQLQLQQRDALEAHVHTASAGGAPRQRVTTRSNHDWKNAAAAAAASPAHAATHRAARARARHASLGSAVSQPQHTLQLSPPLLDKHPTRGGGGRHMRCAAEQHAARQPPRHNTHRTPRRSSLGTAACCARPQPAPSSSHTAGRALPRALARAPTAPAAAAAAAKAPAAAPSLKSRHSTGRSSRPHSARPAPPG
jgi:hypothetical protein